MECQLLKAGYGLKQASSAWLKLINTFFRAIGCSRTKIDSSHHILQLDDETVYILVYVDDILMLARSMAILTRIAQIIADRFEVRIKESVSRFLGIIIEQDSAKKTVKIHSCSLIDRMIERFVMIDCKPAKNSLLEGIVLSVNMKSVDEGEKSALERTPYRQLVGCILHLTNTTRPDIAFAAGYLSRFMAEPGSAHWKAAKHVLRYLNGTRKLGIVYREKKGSETTSLRGYADSELVGDVDKRKSTRGQCFLFGGEVISWRNKKQNVIAQYKVEAEHIELSFAVRKALWL